jgi:ribonuclease HI
MYFDGSLKLEGAGAGVLLISPKGEQLKYILQIFWRVSNNEVEYKALLHGLPLAISLGIKRLLVYATPPWSSTKLTSLGIATRRTWTPTA